MCKVPGNISPVPVVTQRQQQGLSTGALKGVWGRTEETCGETKEPQVGKTNNKQIKNSGLDTNLFRNFFFLNVLPQMPSIVTLPKRILTTPHSPQRAAQPPKPSDKDHLSCAALSPRTDTPGQDGLVISCSE